MKAYLGVDPKAFEDELVKMGRLDENTSEGKLFSGKYMRLDTRTLQLATSRPRDRPRSSARATSFHFAHSFISKHPPSVQPAGTAGKLADRVLVHPIRGQVDRAKAQGARYDRKLGMWWVPRGSAAATALRDMTGPRAASNRFRQRDGRGKAARVTGSGFQEYIERAHSREENRHEIERDAEGALSFGSIGETEAERARFWTEVGRRERCDGRVQCRIIAELPHELSSAGRREVVTAFVAAFEARDLPYHAAVHKPDPEKGMDPRNVHLHVVYHDRPMRRRGPSEWTFAPKKDREARGAVWVRALRTRYCEAMNAALEAEDTRRLERGAPVTGKRHDPRSFGEMGVEATPTVHLGPVASAYERAGRPTERGTVNLIVGLERDARLAKRTRDALVERVGRARTELMDVSPAPGEARKLAELERAAVDSVVDVEIPPADPQARIRLRAEWAAREARKLERRIARTTRPTRVLLNPAEAARAAAAAPEEDPRRERLRRLQEIAKEMEMELAYGQTHSPITERSFRPQSSLRIVAPTPPKGHRPPTIPLNPQHSFNPSREQMEILEAGSQDTLALNIRTCIPLVEKFEKSVQAARDKRPIAPAVQEVTRSISRPETAASVGGLGSTVESRSPSESTRSSDPTSPPSARRKSRDRGM